MYSILEASGNSFKKAKGVKKNTVKKHIHHEQYKEALFEKQTFRHGMDVLRSERLNKVSLSPFDSKRWIAENGVNTLAYGHKDAIPAGWALQRYALGKTTSGGICVSGAQQEVPRGRTPAVARRAGNTAQVHRAWSPSVRADTPWGTILDQSHGDGHPLAHPTGKDSERPHLKGAFAPWDQLGGLE